MRGWETAALAALMLAAGSALLSECYLPARRRREKAAAEAVRAETRVRLLRKRVDRLRDRAEALEAGDPQAVEEAIRAELRRGRPGERILRGRGFAGPDGIRNPGR